MSNIHINQRRLFYVMVIVCFFCWLEYDSRVRVQQRLEDKILLLQTEQEFWIKCSKIQSKMIDDLIYTPVWKKEIMPSCLINSQRKLENNINSASVKKETKK